MASADSALCVRRAWPARRTHVMSGYRRIDRDGHLDLVDRHRDIVIGTGPGTIDSARPRAGLS